MAMTGEERREYQRKYYTNNPSRRVNRSNPAYQREHYLTKQREIRSTPEYKSAACERSRKRNATPEGKVKARARLLRNKYNLTPDQFDSMFLSQGSCCAICKSPEPGSKKGWVVDHCHFSEKVRGILCPPCNMMLGQSKDNLETLQSAIDYLRSNGEI